jgi:hypothetical protein
MEISIFATKCRFCGESVGRPRDEARTLTIDDLGGVSQGTDYAPSEHVMDALESFRQEEIEKLREAEEEEAQLSSLWWWQRKKLKKTKRPAGRSSSFGDLDPRSRELADIGTRRRQTKRQYQQIWTKQVAMGAAFVAAVVLLYFGGRMVKAEIDDYLERKNAKPVVAVDNRAMSILQKNMPLEALSEAIRAEGLADTMENRDIADKVREGVAAYIRDRLNSDNWSDSVMHQIEEEINRAVTIDPYSKLLQDVKNEVREEIRLHSITFSDPNPEQGTVTLRLLDDQKPSDLARIGEKVHGRFEIMNITREQVRFKDHERKTSKGIPRQFVLDKFGSFSSI